MVPLWRVAYDVVVEEGHRASLWGVGLWRDYIERVNFGVGCREEWGLGKRHRDLDPIRPDHLDAGRRSGPRKQDVAVLYNVVRFKFCARQIGADSVSRSQLRDLDHWKGLIILRWELLECESVQEPCNLVETTHLPPSRD